jgi:hypothetical protein
MRKIRMGLEELQVESFATTNGDGAGRGTVLGRQSGLNCTAYSDGDEQCQVDPSHSAQGGCICGDMAPSVKQEAC